MELRKAFERKGSTDLIEEQSTQYDECDIMYQEFSSIKSPMSDKRSYVFQNAMSC